LGRPSKQALSNQVSPGERNPFEGKFGQAKTAYGLERITSKTIKYQRIMGSQHNISAKSCPFGKSIDMEILEKARTYFSTDKRSFSCYKYFWVDKYK